MQEFKQALQAANIGLPETQINAILRVIERDEKVRAARAGGRAGARARARTHTHTHTLSAYAGATRRAGSMSRPLLTRTRARARTHTHTRTTRAGPARRQDLSRPVPGGLLRGPEGWRQGHRRARAAGKEEAGRQQAGWQAGQL